MIQSLARRTRKFAVERTKVISAVLHHPLNRGGKVRALRDYLLWNAVRFSMDASHVVRLPEGLEIIVSRAEKFGTAAYVNFVGDFDEMMFFAHLLRAGDRFADVGSNVGLYSLWVARCTGAQGVALEPVPLTFEMLRKNIRLNDLENLVEPIRTAAGDKAGSVLMTSNIGGMNHILSEAGEHTVETPVSRLDDVFSGREPFAMKMDVEGFELYALRGGERLMSDGNLKAIVIELQDGTLNRYGVNVKEVRDFIEGHGFVAYTYDPFTRALAPLVKQAALNMIYVRRADEELVRQRLLAGRKIRLPNYPDGV
jgi:FkbM family methyltransferase